MAMLSRIRYMYEYGPLDFWKLKAQAGYIRISTSAHGPPARLIRHLPSHPPTFASIHLRTCLPACLHVVEKETQRTNSSILYLYLSLSHTTFPELHTYNISCHLKLHSS